MCVRACVCVSVCPGADEGLTVCIVWVIDMDVRMQDCHQMKLLYLFPGFAGIWWQGSRGRQKITKVRVKAPASTPSPLSLCFLCFARGGEPNPDSQLLRLNTQPLWKRPAATRRGESFCSTKLTEANIRHVIAPSAGPSCLLA